MIEQKLDAVALSYVDERSDLSFSQMASHVQGITASEVSGLINNERRISDKKLQPNPYRLHNNTIKEEVENENNADATRTDGKHSKAKGTGR